jgi:hypothetical protein
VRENYISRCESKQTGNKEICGGLSMGWLVTKVDEILPGLIRSTEVCHPAFVDHAYLVEVLI